MKFQHNINQQHYFTPLTVELIQILFKIFIKSIQLNINI